MGREILLGAAALLFASLAGCVTLPGTPATEDGDDGGLGLPSRAVDLGPCRDVTGHFLTPMEQLKGRVPPPLSPRPSDDAGLFGDTWVIGAECGSGGAGGDPAKVGLFLVTIAVDAPPSPAPDGEDLSRGFLVTRFVASDPGLVGMLRGWGQANAEHGQVGFSVTSHPAGTSTSAGPEGDPVSLRVAAGPSQDFGADFVRFFLLDGTRVGGGIDWNVTAGRIGLGVAVLSDGHAGRGGFFDGPDYAYQLTPRTASQLGLALGASSPEGKRGVAATVPLD